MIPTTMDSLDGVEMVMDFEEVFGIEIPSPDTGSLGSPREIVDWLELHLSNLRLIEAGAIRLKKLAQDRDNPQLAEGLNGTWRREQIAAIGREFLK